MKYNNLGNWKAKGWVETLKAQKMYTAVYQSNPGWEQGNVDLCYRFWLLQVLPRKPWHWQVLLPCATCLLPVLSLCWVPGWDLWKKANKWVDSESTVSWVPRLLNDPLTILSFYKSCFKFDSIASRKSSLASHILKHFKKKKLLQKNEIRAMMKWYSSINKIGSTWFYYDN